MRMRIAALFLECCFEDGDILDVLLKEGYQIGRPALVRIRKELGLRRRMALTDKDEANRQRKLLVQREFDKGAIQGYGRGTLYYHLRSQGCVASRDRAFRALKEIDPEGVAARTKDLQRHRGEYIVPGPNYVWSMDGYCKLAPYGIEIYAAIDAYSRYVIWLYVGVSSRTSVSVLKQYLCVVQDGGIVPRILRSDRGTETTLCANAHHMLRSQQSYESTGNNCTLESCYFYGTSTANQRIEAWWAQLSKGALFNWRNYFRQLVEQNLFDSSLKTDRISLLAIFMPIIRQRAHSFVRTWNIHPLRAQPNRPNSIAGQTYKLYHFPSASVSNHGLPPSSPLLQQLAADVAGWDEDEDLPDQTLQWCLTTIGPGDSNEANQNSLTVSPHCTTHTRYLALQTAAREHESSGEEPSLQESEKPLGGYAWQPPNKDVRGNDQNVHVMDIRDEGPGSSFMDDPTL
ncbi:MAG: hypothetical protein M1823_005351 [Watsoniomyces obsoletus]|nr:MAG: hypothetical protein M1823_005351 [Watsoniomyces obsoletus]